MKPLPPENPFFDGSRLNQGISHKELQQIVIPSMTTTALSSKNRRHCSCALAAAVKGAAEAFISTLDSGGKGTTIETGWKRSAS
jgi:hypothetical protein